MPVTTNNVLLGTESQMPMLMGVLMARGGRQPAILPGTPCGGERFDSPGLSCGIGAWATTCPGQGWLFGGGGLGKLGGGLALKTAVALRALGVGLTCKGAWLHP